MPATPQPIASPPVSPSAETLVSGALLTEINRAGLVARMGAHLILAGVDPDGRPEEAASALMAAGWRPRVIAELLDDARAAAARWRAAHPGRPVLRQGGLP